VPNKGYTFKLNSINNRNTAKRVLVTPPVKLIKALNKTVKNKAAAGLAKNTNLFIGPRTVNLLVNSFTASAAGCKIPTAPTLLGPTRAWLIAKHLRSIKVMNATLINTLKIIIKYSSREPTQFILLRERNGALIFRPMITTSTGGVGLLAILRGLVVGLRSRVDTSMICGVEV